MTDKAKNIIATQSLCGRRKGFWDGFSMGI
jgi:hypothetical protein